MLKMMICMDNEKIAAEQKYHWKAFIIHSITHSITPGFSAWKITQGHWCTVTADVQKTSVCLGKL